MSSAMDVSGAEGAWPRSKARMSGPETGYHILWGYLGRVGLTVGS